MEDTDNTLEYFKIPAVTGGTDHEIDMIGVIDWAIREMFEQDGPEAVQRSIEWAYRKGQALVRQNQTKLFE